MKFSKNKFLSLSEKSQKKKLYDLMRKIEKKWSLPVRYHLLDSLNNLINYTRNSTDPIIQEIRSVLSNIKPNSKFSEIQSAAGKLERILNINPKETDFLIEKEDKITSENSTIELYLILDNLRSAFNVGSIFRTAECLGVKKIYLCGITPTPRNKKVKSTSMGTFEYIKWEYKDSTRKLVKSLKDRQKRIIALETVKNATKYNQTVYNLPSYLILGNEALGIESEILQMTDSIIKIPVFGWKNSLNVAISFGIVGYKIREQVCK